MKTLGLVSGTSTHESIKKTLKQLSRAHLQGDPRANPPDRT
jgi:hypothetical protein